MSSITIKESVRTEAPFDVAERPMLESWLDYHRETLAWKCSGLTADQLKERSVAPSRLSLLVLLRHMTKVEWFWFGRILSGADPPALYVSRDGHEPDFEDLDDSPPKDVYSLWETATAEARRFAAAVDSLDQRAQKNPWMEPPSLRWIMLHMIEEYARHNGHADFLRECIDGSTGD